MEHKDTFYIMRQPTLFIPHGAGPCFFMNWDPANTWNRHRKFLENLPALLPNRPDAILIVSAHWEEQIFTIQKNNNPGLLFDYSGFPEETYQLQWPARGDLHLALQVRNLLEKAGNYTHIDENRGYDHGVFVPLKIAFPSADIPCVQLSLQAGLDPETHYLAGESLTSLRDENVLIIGSGNTFHNIPVLMRGIKNKTDNIAGYDFDDWLTKSLTNQNLEERRRLLFQWSEAPGARHSHPREEHLAPLFLVAGSAAGELCKKVFEDAVLGAVESAFMFG